MRNFGSPGFSSALEVPRVNAQWLTFSSLPIAATSHGPMREYSSLRNGCDGAAGVVA